MKTVQKISAVALLALFLISSTSCKKQNDDEEYEIPENDAPQAVTMYTPTETNHFYGIS